jgi:hypothetical protein
VKVVDEFPMTVTGKVRKMQMREAPPRSWGWPECAQVPERPGCTTARSQREACGRPRSLHRSLRVRESTRRRSSVSCRGAQKWMWTILMDLPALTPSTQFEWAAMPLGSLTTIVHT